MQVRVAHLADHPKALPILSQWLFDEWGHRSPGGTVQRMSLILKERMNRNRLPLALVALQNDQPLGTASLRIRELEIRSQYEYWLGTLFVHETHRCRGVGTLLIGAAADEAKRLGIQELYLYTRQRQNEALYSKLGWIPVERLEYQGRQAVIMKRVLLSDLAL
jgi:GNAT superfamily N-acetyltransferase